MVRKVIDSWVRVSILGVFLFAVFEVQGTAARSIEESAAVDRGYTVSVKVTPAAGVFVYALEETIPRGWSVEQISENGLFDMANSTIKWGPYFDNSSREFGYLVIAPENLGGDQSIAGMVSYDGDGLVVEGHTMVPVDRGLPIKVDPKLVPVGERRLPARIDSGSSVQVVINVTPMSGVSVYAVEEALPSGLVVSNVGGGGSYDLSSGRIKWGPYFDDSSRSLSYEIQWGGLGESRFEFEGLVSVDGDGVPIGGAQSLVGVPPVSEPDPNPAPSPNPPVRQPQALRELPANVEGGRDIVVSLRANPVAGTSAYALEERLPAEVRFVSVDSGGQFDNELGVLKWGPYFDSEERLLRYTIRVPSTAMGPLDFVGRISSDGQGEDIGGAQVLSVVVADPPLTAGGSAKRELPGSARPSGSVEIVLRIEPPAGVSVYAIEESVPDGALVETVGENGQIDLRSDSIKWGPFFDNQSRSFGYTLRLQDSATEALRFTGRLSLDGASEAIGGDGEILVVSETGNPLPEGESHRVLPESVPEGREFEVSVRVMPTEGVSVYAVEEKLSAGLVPSAISDGGQFDSVSQSIKWGPFFDANTRTLSYQLTVGADRVGLLEFAGALSLDGKSQSIGGDLSLSILPGGDSPAPPLPPGVGVCREGGGLLTFLNSRGLVRDIDGTAVEADVFGQVYAGRGLDDLQPICQPAQAFGGGLFVGGEVAIPGFAGGESVFVQLRAWKGAARYELASIRGVSEAVSVTLVAPDALVPAPVLPTAAFSLQKLSDPPSLLPLRILNGILTIEWEGVGRLQWAEDPSGPYADHPNQMNPQSVDISAHNRRFYRVVEN